MDAPTALVAKSGEGKQQTLVAAGAPLPAAGRVVVATERAGQDALELELLAGDAPFARVRFPLPRGLPANCWIPVEVSVGPDLRVRAEASENLRRLRVAGEFTLAPDAAHFRA